MSLKDSAQVTIPLALKTLPHLLSFLAKSIAKNKRTPPTTSYLFSTSHGLARSVLACFFVLPDWSYPIPQCCHSSSTSSLSSCSTTTQRLSKTSWLKESRSILLQEQRVPESLKNKRCLRHITCQQQQSSTEAKNTPTFLKMCPSVVRTTGLSKHSHALDRYQNGQVLKFLI